MLIVGITGGIGSGKTTVCRIFKLLGIPVYDADSRAKWLMNNDPRLRSSIIDLLGEQSYNSDGELNRQYVSQQIFSDKDKLNKINALVHPAVARDAVSWFEQYSSQQYVLYEAALLVENGSYKNFDRLIVVSAPEEIRISRVMARDQVSRHKVKARIDNQLPEEEKLKVADYVINNSGEVLLIPQVWAIHQDLLGLSDSTDQKEPGSDHAS